MKQKQSPPDVAGVLDGLKDFQRETARYVFRRLYLDQDYTRRFLVADEVGLGKTLVARAVIAQAIDHLWDKVQRIDIVYICSNADIAKQNINRLTIDGKEEFVFSSRATLLPIELHNLKKNKLNDFLGTLSFLEADNAGSDDYQRILRQYRSELYRLGVGGTGQLQRIKSELESKLRRVIVRTERLGSSENGVDMLAEVPTSDAKLGISELNDYRALQKLAELLDHGDTIEYWKSAPYLLNFMDEYKIKKELKDLANQPEQNRKLLQTIKGSKSITIDWNDVRAYRHLEPANARLRWLMRDTIDREAWKILWLPPSMPYYRPEGPFADPRLHSFTKRLLFSSWHVVPKAVALLLSYEAERHMMSLMEETPENTPEARDRRTGLLRFTRSEDRLTGMPVLALLYPSAALARCCDPLEAISNGQIGDISAVLASTQKAIEEHLAEIFSSAPLTGPADEDWYWAAPILLDLRSHESKAGEWWCQKDLASFWSEGDKSNEDEEERTGWDDHVDRALEVVTGKWPRGRPPDDLAEKLTYMALAAPGVVAMRAFEHGHDI
jgi:hypothetical protein